MSSIDIFFSEIPPPDDENCPQVTPLSDCFNGSFNATNERTVRMGFPLSRAPSIALRSLPVDDGVQKKIVEKYKFVICAFQLLTFSRNMGIFFVDIQECNYYSDHI